MDLKAFAGPSGLQCSEGPPGAACQRLPLMREGSWQRGLCHLRDNWAREGRLEIDFHFYICEDRSRPNTEQFLPVLGKGDK